MDFEQAKQATQDMIDNIDNPDTEENNVDESQELPVQDEQEQSAENNEQSQIDEAANIAEAAAQAAASSNQQNNEAQQQIQQLIAENEQLKRANTELQDTITQQSQTQQESIIEEAMEMPALDMNALAFEDEETVRQIQQDYANKMRDYVMNGIKKEIEPAVEYARAGMRERERTDVINALKDVPELNGIEGMVPQLDAIIKANKALSSDDVPMDEKYITAYAIARGVNSINTPPPEPPSDPTAYELMEYYNKNPEFQQLIEKKRLEDIKQSQQVPNMSASNGAVNAALNIQEKPKTWEEASERTRDLFREKDE